MRNGWQLCPLKKIMTLSADLLLCVVVGVILNTMMLHGSKELDAQKSVQRHEEQEKDGHIVDLLT